MQYTYIFAINVERYTVAFVQAVKNVAVFIILPRVKNLLFSKMKNRKKTLFYALHLYVSQNEVCYPQQLPNILVVH